MAKKIRTSEVFVPGGMPSLTYVTRTGPDLERRLRQVEANLCKLVVLTGATKSGKTVLVNKIFPRSERAIWIDGGTAGSEVDLWSTVLEELQGSTSIEVFEGTEKGIAGGSNVEGGAGLPLFARLGIKLSASATVKQSTSKRFGLTKSPRAAALAELRRTRAPLIVDDFHYLDRKLQGSVVRALKPLIFDGLPIVCIAIPHRRYDAVKVEREMTGRLEPIEVSAWSVEELTEIAHVGFPLLNMRLDRPAIDALADESYGSPHLMQEFCQRLAAHHQVEQTLDQVLEVTCLPRALFQDIASSIGKVIFDKLKKGPRQRSDRKKRTLAKGGTVDTYEAVLMALSRLSPGLERVDYEQLRGAVRELLVSEDVPQAHEISRVLEKMSEIASSDEASTPVLDWDKDDRQLHITDPFFAFVLKWGKF
jgi:hypothetical protein